MPSVLLIGDGEPARALLDALLARPEIKVNALVTAGAETSSPARLAQAHRIPISRPDRLVASGNSGALIESDIDWLLSINNLFVLPAEILAACRRGALNLHPGLLPEYAGLHTHQWAIRNGEKEFGVTLHFMEPKVDSGPIVRRRRFPIYLKDTGLSLFRRCVGAGVELFKEIVPQLAGDVRLPATPQDLSRRRVYRHRDSMDGRIDWRWTADAIEAFVRAGNYEPFRSPSYTAVLDAIPDFAIEVLRVEVEGQTKKPPGAIVDASDKGPLIACGDGRMVRVVRARVNGGPLDGELWRRYAKRLGTEILAGRADGAIN